MFILDEIHLKKHTWFNGKELTGITNIGGGGEGSVPATKSLAFMVNCLILKNNRFVFTCLSNKYMIMKL